MVEFWPLAKSAKAKRVESVELATAPAILESWRALYICEKAEISEAWPKKRAAPKIKRRELTTKAKVNWMLESQVMKRTAFVTSLPSE